jgi:hypothetical protein
MTPELSDADIALIRRYWPSLPGELVTPQRAAMARERAQEAADTAVRVERARWGRNIVWVKGARPGPLTLAEIQESVQMNNPRPPRPDRDRNFTNGLMFLAGALVLAWCCGAGCVGTLWKVFG